jgi:hypothetical protein
MEFYAAVVPPAIVGGPRTPLPVPRDARAIDVALFSARMRYSLRCAVR